MTNAPTPPTPPRDPAPGLRLRAVSKILGGRKIVEGLDLDVAQGELICLLGPSGCGKTTTLRMIGGFLAADTGTLEIDGIDYTHAPPEKRPTAMVFQNYALWPHMSVTANIAFGLTLRRMSRAAVREKVDWALDLVNLSHHRDTMPARISGGEQQRVALARALVLEPKVLLMDEPLSNLDAKLRVKVREDIREIQQRLGITTVLVTHDQDEAMAMGDRIAVMNSGRIEQHATPTELYAAPATSFVAEFIGAMNLIDTSPTAAGVTMADDRVLPVEFLSAGAGDRVGIRPEDLVLSGAGAAGTCPATVSRIVPRGHFQEILLDCGGTSLRAYSGAALPSGSEVGVRARRALVYENGLLQNDAASYALPRATRSMPDRSAAQQHSRPPALINGSGHPR
jgi:putative spermidine/putrescine transport system ATP-binding protein